MKQLITTYANEAIAALSDGDTTDAHSWLMNIAELALMLDNVTPEQLSKVSNANLEELFSLVEDREVSGLIAEELQKRGL